MLFYSVDSLFFTYPSNLKYKFNSLIIITYSIICYNKKYRIIRFILYFNIVILHFPQLLSLLALLVQLVLLELQQLHCQLVFQQLLYYSMVYLGYQSQQKYYYQNYNQKSYYYYYILVYTYLQVVEELVYQLLLYQHVLEFVFPSVVVIDQILQFQKPLKLLVHL